MKKISFEGKTGVMSVSKMRGFFKLRAENESSDNFKLVFKRISNNFDKAVAFGEPSDVFGAFEELKNDRNFLFKNYDNAEIKADYIKVLDDGIEYLDNELAV